MTGAFRKARRIVWSTGIVGLLAAGGWVEVALRAQEVPARTSGAATAGGGAVRTVGPQTEALAPSPPPDSAPPGAPVKSVISHQAQPAEDSKPRMAPGEIKELRAEIVKRIEAVDAAEAAKKADAAATKNSASEAKPIVDAKALRDLLKIRLDWMTEYEKADQEHRQATETNPDQDRAKAEAEIEKLGPLLIQAEKSPDALLPEAFHRPANQIDDAVRKAMKDAIEAVQNELKDWTTKYEAAKADVAKTAEVRTAMRAQRDKIFQRVAALKVRDVDAPPAAAKTAKEAKVGAPSAEAADSSLLDSERRLNAEWEVRAESLRLTAQEARIARDAKLTAVDELEVRIGDAHVRIAQKVLDRMQQRFRSASDIQQRDLKRAAASEENLAAVSDDPLVRFRARRNAELLELEAQTVKFEQRATSNLPPSPEEQRALAERERKDFEGVKRLITDGEVSRLDAILLNNDFRRIGPERDRIERNELKAVEARVQFYGNALTEAELELLEDARQDQFEHEALLERLPDDRRSAAGLVFAEIEGKHRALLIRRRDALKILADRAAETVREVKSRLTVLDEKYGFIRTNIFWVRDQDPIGLDLISQGARETARLGQAFSRIAGEAVDTRNWTPVSAEFAAAVAALVVLPFGLFRFRRELGGRIATHLPDLGAGAAPTAPTAASDSAGSSTHNHDPD